MNKDDYHEILGRLARHIPSTMRPNRQNDPELYEVYRALQEVIVNFPKHMPMDHDKVIVLRALFAMFGETNDNQDKQIDAMLLAAIKEATEGSKEFWTKALHTEKSAKERLKREDLSGYDNQLPRSIKELAGLLVHAIDNISKVESLEDINFKRSSTPYQTASVTITVQLTFDPLTYAIVDSVSLAGDLDNWYLAILRAKINTRGNSLPHTLVIFKGDPHVSWTIEDSSGKILKTITSATLLRNIERRVIREYKIGSDELVVRICQLAIQYCNDYYNEPELIGGVISAILNQVWWRDQLDSSVKLALDFAGSKRAFEMSVPIYIRISEIVASASRRGLTLDISENQSQLSEYISEYLDYVCFLDKELIRWIALPLIIGIWLWGDETPAYDPEKFFRPGWWRLIED